MMSSEKESFPAAYSSFAVSVDSRAAERGSPVYSSNNNINDSNSPGILRNTRGSSSPYSYGHEKKRSLSPKSEDRDRFDRFEKGTSTTIAGKPGVRFTKDTTIHEYDHRLAGPSPLHHRRSSTAAFIEYIRTHLPEHNRNASIAITPKRAVLLFAIVFTATYLAMAMVPVLSGLAGFGSPVTVVIRRGDGYYGNSRIFRGGENLADPHLAGDEHNEFLAAHAAHPAGRRSPSSSSENEAVNQEHEHEHEHERAYAGAKTQGKQRTLRTSTLAEEATLQELKAARAKAKADALLRAQRFSTEDDDELNNVDLEEKLSNPVILKVKEAALRKKPIMPLRKLAAKVRGGEASEGKESPLVPSHGESTPAEAREPAEFMNTVNSNEDVGIEKEVEQTAEGSGAGTMEESRNNNGEDEAELEGIIAKLRKEALDRRLNKIHKAQKDVAKSAGKNNKLEMVVDNEAKIRRPGIVKSRKVSTKEE